MPVEFKRTYAGHQIVLKISIWEKPVAKLYIDGKVVDTAGSNTTSRGALVRGAITENERTHIVEVQRTRSFTKPIFLVDGERID